MAKVGNKIIQHTPTRKETMKSYKKILETLKQELNQNKEQRLFCIVTDIDGSIYNTLYNKDKIYLSIEDAENDIQDFAKQQNVEPCILKFSVVDNKKKILEESEVLNDRQRAEIRRNLSIDENNN